ncbi:MurR/RpiR family transcriptional regulator [Streptomyces sp. NPDC007164]|uniref:MurR/RpiR family transcriptional regulator n=1 Tax=Streptomyces sp. NPDC007164 TaxID=3156918 RepID=UPI0033E28FBE
MSYDPTRSPDLVTKRLSEIYPELPRGEQAIVRVLLDDYPFAALGSLRSLAERAKVSPPTASRLIARLGWNSFADFQAAVRAQSREHDQSRLREFVSFSPTEPNQAAQDLLTGLNGTIEAATEPLLARTGALLAGAGSVWGIGGPLSELAADYLVRQLSGLRPRVNRVPDGAAAQARVVVDLGPHDVVVAYDFRRYSQNTARFVRATRARGAQLVLVTDAWESPLAGDAEVLLRLPREAAGPIAPLTHVVAVTELVLVATVPHLTSSTGRLEELEALTEELKLPH